MAIVSILFLVLGAAAAIGGFICSIMILIAAFQDELWKGFVCLLCGLYFLYFALVDYDADNKWGIVAGSLLGGAIASACFLIAGPGLRPH